MILSAQSIRNLCHADEHLKHMIAKYPEVYSWKYPNPLITPFVERGVVNGKSFGLSQAGYDIRIDKLMLYNNTYSELVMRPGDFVLASSMERIVMPPDLLCIVHDKSSWARQGLALQNTVLEPGWEGYITLELSFHKPLNTLKIEKGDAIAQLIFHKLDYETEAPYAGKYQDQPDRPMEAIDEQAS